jgi:ADP-ribose pyrophosphatase YjhB (NUDIX family)
VTGREYPARPIVGIGVVVLRNDSVLLVRRGKPPNVGSWTLPGGAQEIGETAEAAARRELLEETGIEVGDLHFAAVVDSIRRDADQRVQYHYTIIDFCARWAAGEPMAGTDVTEAVWAPLDVLEPFDLWSEAHRVIAVSRRLLR